MGRFIQPTRCPRRKCRQNPPLHSRRQALLDQHWQLQLQTRPICEAVSRMHMPSDQSPLTGLRKGEVTVLKTKGSFLVGFDQRKSSAKGWAVMIPFNADQFDLLTKVLEPGQSFLRRSRTIHDVSDQDQPARLVILNEFLHHRSTLSHAPRRHEASGSPPPDLIAKMHVRHSQPASRRAQKSTAAVQNQVRSHLKAVWRGGGRRHARA